MEKNIRFRNHISVVLENTVRTIGVLFFIFVGNIVSSLDEMESMEDMGGHTLLLVLLLIGVLALLLGWQILIWAKTYISIQDNVLVVERNTLNKKRNTIGIKNISNINLEQNLLEMILGTCKLKLDTNSLSTAEATDVKIVLKKSDAEKFRRLILEHNEENITTEEERIGGEEGQFTSGMDDIVTHGLFSLNIASVFVLAGAIFGAIGIFADFSMENAEGGLLGLILSILVAVWCLGGFAWSVAKGFIKYIDFKIARRGDKIFLSYGLFKKVAYSIPVDKINAVRFTQTMVARIGKRYMVEVVNVGLDDDETEEQSFFLPYAKREVIEERMKSLLPEFAEGMNIIEEKQPRQIWFIWLPAAITFLIIGIIAYAVCLEVFVEAKIPVLVAWCAIGILLLVKKCLSYRTRGIVFDDKFLKVVDGAFGKRSLLVRYEKIQYLTARQNVIAKKFGLQRGEIHLLASMKNQIHNIPYFKEEKIEKIKSDLL